MILPIHLYGDTILRQECKEVTREFSGLESLVENMWETMYNADGVGLAAPQVGQAIRLFIVDTFQLLSDNPDRELKIPAKGIKQVFINPIIVDTQGPEWTYEEGCLSIPAIRADVIRDEKVSISYMDMDFKRRTEEFYGIEARVILHENDHVNGILFTDKISPLKKSLLARKLDKIRKGKVSADYPLKPKQKSSLKNK